MDKSGSCPTKEVTKNEAAPPTDATTSAINDKPGKLNICCECGCCFLDTGISSNH